MSKRKHRPNRENLLTSPGTLTYIGPDIELKTKVRKLQYNTSFYTDDAVTSLAACAVSQNLEPHITWLDVDGIHETSLVGKIGQLYHLHPLILEDIVNTEHKPKLEVYDAGYVFLTMKMLHVDAENPLEVSAEHVSFVAGNDYLISFQEERTDDIFRPVIDRLKASVGKTRRNRTDYLLFALMDIIVDNYFLVLEKFGEKLDIIEESIISESNQNSLNDLYTLKRELTFVRRAIWPLRDMINQLIREDNPLISKEVVPYYRDLYDHTMQAVDTIDSYRELLASLADVHLSTTSNRMNAVMKTLTIFSAIFMPLTFIVGVYGMNFRYMPELEDPNGYYYTWAVMAMVTIGLVMYFKSKKWM